MTKLNNHNNIKKIVETFCFYILHIKSFCLIYLNTLRY